MGSGSCCNGVDDEYAHDLEGNLERWSERLYTWSERRDRLLSHDRLRDQSARLNASLNLQLSQEWKRTSSHQTFVASAFYLERRVGLHSISGRTNRNGGDAFMIVAPSLYLRNNAEYTGD
jgi:hypothetical protein